MNAVVNVWNFIASKLQINKNVMLLFVVESKGSSPGRAGFAMAVASDDSFNGTIGGGIMEYKLVEKAKVLLQQNQQTIFLQEQFHDKEHGKNQSGMICSGSQKIVFIPLLKKDEPFVESIVNQNAQSFTITPASIAGNSFAANEWMYLDDNNWSYSQNITTQNTIHIIGGGHCALALSQLMKFLGFNIEVYDDRENLNTLEQNIYASKKHVVDYENLNKFFCATPADYVVIMTVGYRTDKIVLKQIINNNYTYLGLLGSLQKINVLMNELKTEGFAEALLNRVYTPVGININSKTTQEIAVSIAAEIIQIKNSIN